MIPDDYISVEAIYAKFRTLFRDEAGGRLRFFLASGELSSFYLGDDLRPIPIPGERWRYADDRAFYRGPNVGEHNEAMFRRYVPAICLAEDGDRLIERLRNRYSSTPVDTAKSQSPSVEALETLELPHAELPARDRALAKSGRALTDPTTAGANEPHAKASSAASAKGKRGRKPNPEVEALKPELFRLLCHHGDFASSDPEWNCQERAVEQLLHIAGEGFTGETALRGRMTGWVEEFRKRKQAGQLL